MFRQIHESSVEQLSYSNQSDVVPLAGDGMAQFRWFHLSGVNSATTCLLPSNGGQRAP